MQMFGGQELTFSAGNHSYRWGGKPVPSVTAIIKQLDKPALVGWAAKCTAEYIRQRLAEAEKKQLNVDWDGALAAAAKHYETVRGAGADIGTAVHEFARASLSRELPSMPENISPGVAKGIAAFLSWKASHEIEPMGIERRVFSLRHLYAGTTDFYGKIDGIPSVLDFKTGGVYPEAWVQLAGYEMALEEELGLNVRLNHWAIHLDKGTGIFKAYLRHAGPMTQAAELVWLRLVELYKAQKLLKKMTGDA